MSTTSSRANSRAAFWFLVAAATTAGWLALSYSFPGLDAPTAFPISLALIVLCNGMMLFGLWRGLARTDFAARERAAAWLTVTACFILWFATIYALAVRGTFRPVGGANRILPALPLAIVLPVVAGLVLLTRSKRIGALLDATPPSWLIGLQVYRILGGVFLANWLQGSIPAAFALPAGIGDITVGLLALPAALWVSTGLPVGRKVGVWWNVLGLADFAVAIAMGMTTSPGRFQLFAHSHPNAQLGTFPTVMIPAFAVPLSILLHALSLRQLGRLASREAGVHPAGIAGGRVPRPVSV
jgi:hypothetical protein